MDSYGSRINSENPLCVYFQPKRNSKNSKRAEGTGNFVQRANFGVESLEIPEQDDYSRPNKALKPPKVNEYRLEKPEMKKPHRQNVFIDSYYPVVSGDLSEDCEESKKSQNFGKDSIEDLPKKNDGVKFTRKLSEFEQEEAQAKLMKAFQDKRRQRKPFRECRQEPEKFPKKPKAGILKGDHRKSLEPPLQKDISEMTFDCKTYTVNSCMSDKDVSFDVSTCLEASGENCRWAQQQKACAEKEPMNENKIKAVGKTQNKNSNTRPTLSNVPPSLETSPEDCDCNQRQKTSPVFHLFEEQADVFHRKPANENVTKIVEKSQNAASINCNGCEALSAIDCFAQLYRRIETLEELLQKSLAHRMAVKKMKSKSKSGTREANSPDNYEVYFESKYSQSGVWFFDTPSASESSTLKEKNFDSEDSDTDSELRKIKKRLKVLERKLRVLSSTCNNFLFADDVIGGHVKDCDAFSLESKKSHGRDLYILSKEKKDGNHCSAGDFTGKNFPKKDKVKSFLSKHKILKRKCSSVISSSRNSYPLSISNEILYQHSVITKKSVDRTLCCYSFSPKLEMDKNEDENVTKVMFVRRFKQKNQEPDMRIRKKNTGKLRRRRKDLCRKNSKTNISFLWYKPNAMEKSEKGISPSRKSITFGDNDKSLESSDYGDYEKIPSINSMAFGDHGKSLTKNSSVLIDNEESSSRKSSGLVDEESQSRSSLTFGDREKSPIRNSSNFGDLGERSKNSFGPKFCEFNRNPTERKENSKQSFPSTKQTPREILAESCPGTHDLRCKTNLGPNKNEPRDPGPRFGPTQRPPCPFYVPPPSQRSFSQNSPLKGAVIPEDVCQKQEEKMAHHPTTYSDALKILKSGGNIKIPVLFEKTNRKPGKKGGSNLSMRFFVVEGDIKNPRATLKKLVKQLSRVQSSSKQPEQYVFGLMKNC